MSADRDPVEELLASISDGRPVDWDEASRSFDPAERQRLGALRDISRIAEFSRSLQLGGEGSSMPERWGHLLLLERVGGGAHAEVFRAWDPGLQREVALKLLRPGGDAASLMDEGRAAARIRHPHVVTVHGIDYRDGRVGLWMELIRGTDLEREVRARGPLTAGDAARLGVQVGSALAAVHAAGLLHRDVKPANVVRDAEGRHVLADFGLGIRGGHEALTLAAGTPMYMAPELLAGAAASERSDVYSLGLLLWFALAGRHPFEAGSLAELVHAAQRGPRPGLREARPDAPAALVAAVERAAAPDPRLRFAAAWPMVEALGPCASSGRPARRRPGRRIAVALAAALLALGLFVAWRTWRVPAPDPTVLPPAVRPVETYAVEASFLRRDERAAVRLASGDRVQPGDRLSLEFRASRPAWVYVLNEDERGERYLLFPQPRFDLRNPLAGDSTLLLPGPAGGQENAWTVTSAGGREHFLVVAGLEPVPELEAELGRLPAPEPGRPIVYATVGDASVERLRGVGGVAQLPIETAAPAPRAQAFDRFRALAGRETEVRGVWVRQIVFENPSR